MCGQQLSTASAAAIRARLFAAFDPFHHDTVRRARADKLKRLGLSAPKIKSIREIGKALAKGHIDLGAVGNMEADAAHATLTALHGVGPWTRRYLSACSASAMPMRSRPATSPCRKPRASHSGFASGRTPKALGKIAEAWRPWRGVAAHLLWAYYHAVKKRDVVPVQPQAKQAKKRKNRNG